MGLVLVGLLENPGGPAVVSGELLELVSPDIEVEIVFRVLSGFLLLRLHFSGLVVLEVVVELGPQLYLPDVPCPLPLDGPPELRLVQSPRRPVYRARARVWRGNLYKLDIMSYLTQYTESQEREIRS